METDIFFTKLIDFHTFHAIDTHYSCVSQKYNHIPENEVLINKDTMSIAIKVYAKYFVGREWCFDPW